MEKEVHVNMLRIFDWKDGCFFGLCRHDRAMGMLDFMDDDGPWCDECSPETSVIVDSSEPIQFTDPTELRVASMWLMAAAMWLEAAQSEGGLLDG